MRPLREIRRNKAIEKVWPDVTTVFGGGGAIQIGEWHGSVIWGTNEKGWEHVSVAPYDISITPSWEDMCKVKEVFWEDEDFVIQVHPPKSLHINLMPNCLHLWRPLDSTLLEGLSKVTLV